MALPDAKYTSDLLVYISKASGEIDLIYTLYIKKRLFGVQKARKVYEICIGNDIYLVFTVVYREPYSIRVVVQD